MTPIQLAIALIPKEAALVERIELDHSKLQGPDDVRRNGDLIGELLQSLKLRGGIPEHRLSWFLDPEYFVGGHGSSRKDWFERGGADNIPYHPGFLKFLKYFLNGPDLPESIVQTFAREVESCGDITSGDVIPLANFARTQARQAGLKGREVAEEFFKLALECGVPHDYALTIRKHILEVR